MAKKTLIGGGGGYGSKPVSHRYEPKAEPKPHAVDVASVSTLGMAVQFRKPDLVSGPGYRGGPQQDTGLRGQYDAKTSGPGSLRTTYKAGSQSLTPPPRPIGPTKDTLAEYGPEISGPSRRR